MMINVTQREHPFAGLHPDYPKTREGRAEARAFDAGERADAQASPSPLYNPNAGPAPAARVPQATGPNALADSGLTLGGGGVGPALPPAPSPYARPAPAPVGAAYQQPTLGVRDASGNRAPPAPAPAAAPAGHRVGPPGGLVAFAQPPPDAGAPRPAGNDLSTIDAIERERIRRDVQGTVVAASKGGKFETAESVHGKTPMDPVMREGYLSTERVARSSADAYQVALDDAKHNELAEQGSIAAGYDSAAGLVQRGGNEQASRVARERDRVQADIAKTEIDPSHLFKSMGTGGTIIAVIGQALGAFGAGINHGPNYCVFRPT